mmetsp:Transcript_112137/g.219854  ORF Transcript_112137/g.219854 Transcript_112137/m.219854 type:complete len:86 (-) Transcript_112137:421-678(-)
MKQSAVVVLNIQSKVTDYTKENHHYTNSMLMVRHCVKTHLFAAMHAKHETNKTSDPTPNHLVRKSTSRIYPTKANNEYRHQTYGN